MKIIVNIEEAKILEEAVTTFNLRPILSMLQEECEKLIIAASQLSQGRAKVVNEVVDEMAEVAVLLKMMICAIECEDAFKEMTSSKIERMKDIIKTIQTRQIKNG